MEGNSFRTSTELISHEINFKHEKVLTKKQLHHTLYTSFILLKILELELWDHIISILHNREHEFESVMSTLYFFANVHLLE